jgi:acetolactate synthase-1/2/3 large subunit
MLREAARPVIIAGNGVRLSGAVEEFAKFVEQSGLPVVTTYLGIDIVPSDSPQYVGRVGTKGQRAANFAVQNADLLLCIGAAMHVTLVGHEYELFSPKSRKIIVDIMPKESHNRLVKPDLYVQSDALLFIRELSKISQAEKMHCPQEWASACSKWREKYPAVSEQNSKGELVNSYYLTDRISRKLNQKDVVVCDAGTPFYVVAQSIFIARGVRYITPGSMGTMGYNLPASIGASVAGGQGRVVCITGDGSFQMNIQELQTIVQYALPVKIFVINNDGYMSIRAAQSRYFGRFIGESRQSGLSCPDLRKIAQAYGIPYLLISKPSEVESAVQNALFSSGPLIVEVLSPRNQLIEPVVAAERKPDGTMVSKPLHDMFPYLDRKVVEEETRFLREPE